MAINLNGTGSITGLSSISSPTISGGSFPAGTAAAPGITLSGDSDTGLYSPGANQIAITTSGTAAVTVDASQRVGIGTSTPSQPLHVLGAGTVARLDSSSTATLLRFSNSSNALGYIGYESSNLTFYVNDSERFRCDSSGRLLVGTSSARSNFFNGVATAQLQSEGTTNDTSTISFVQNNSAGTSGPRLVLGKSNGSTVGSNTLVASGNGLGTISFQGNDGTEFVDAASITAEVDGTPGANDMPGRLVFSTTADGASSPTERMTIKNDGTIRITRSGVVFVIDAGKGAFYREDANTVGIGFSTNSLLPTDNAGNSSDNTKSLGSASFRWSVVYAGTGTINTSDANLKQDVEDLDAAELKVATAIKGRIKKFRFTDAVAEKGNDARIHVGVIAQEVEQAFVDEGLDPRRYALFCEDTLEDGSKRLGIRYDELLAFVIAAL